MTPHDPGPAPARSGVAADIHLLALERRLVEERAERERIGEDLADANVRLEALSTHQASAVERANEVVRLEGELAAALVRAEAAERRAASLEQKLKSAQRQGAEAEQLKSRLEDVKEDLAEARAPLDVDPLPSRVARRRRSLAQEDTNTRMIAAGRGRDPARALRPTARHHRLKPPAARARTRSCPPPTPALSSR